MVVKRIAPLAAAKLAGLIYALIGLAFALLAWIVSMVGLNYSGLSSSVFLPFAPGFIMLGGAVAVIVLPLVYGAFCFVMTLIGAWLYNLAAGFVGGISMEIQMEVSPNVIAGVDSLATGLQSGDSPAGKDAPASPELRVNRRDS